MGDKKFRMFFGGSEILNPFLCHCRGSEILNLLLCSLGIRNSKYFCVWEIRNSESFCVFVGDQKF